MFTQLLNQHEQVIQDVSEYGRLVSSSQDDVCFLSYSGAGHLLLYPFQPQTLHMAVDSGRVYHGGPEKLSGVGLIKSSLAIELSGFFKYGVNSTSSPVGLEWKGHYHELDNSVIK